jgi:hypothetical protein
MNKHDALLAGVGAAAFGGGLAAGYLLARHRIQRRFQQDLDQLKAHYATKAKIAERAGLLEHFEVVPALGTTRLRRDEAGSVGPYRDVPARRVVRAESDIDGGPEHAGSDGEGPDGQPEAEDDGPEVVYDPSDDLDPVQLPGNSGEPDSRGPGPYVISEAEFFGEQENYAKLSIMYYQKDNVLVDDKAEPIPDIRATVGPDIAQKFGLDPENPYIVYVRNDKLEVDFEVALDYGAYVEVVLNYGQADPKRLKRPVEG